MDIFHFIFNLALYVWLASAIFWGLASAAYASWSTLKSVPLWGSLGFALPFLGLLAAIVADLVQRKQNPQLRAPTQTTDYRYEAPVNASADDSGY